MKNQSYTCFYGHHRLVNSDLMTVLTQTKSHLDQGGGSVLIFDNRTGRQTDFDFRGTLEEVLARAVVDEQPMAAAKPGPGRPRLGVVSTEVSLLPRHWDWLNAQPAKASATIRRLVDEVRQKAVDNTKDRLDAVANFMWGLCGNFPYFEEATRALYARNWSRFRMLIKDWPADVNMHIVEELAEVLPELPPGGQRPIGERPVWTQGTLELSRRIARGDLDAKTVMEAFLGRIQTTNPQLKALSSVWVAEAMTMAGAVDARLERGEAVGPLAGIPFVVKANMAVLGKATDQGIPALATALADQDAPLVARLRAAGAIPIAHSNLPDLSLRFDTVSSLHGRTVNPWAPGLSPGGSSGGGGVALAAGMAPLALGNDVGGSLRLPALFAGCAALKPGFGRFAADHRLGGRDPGLASQLIPVDGLLARSVVDLALVYELVAGPDPRDPRVLPLSLRGPVLQGPIRVAVADDPAGTGLHPGVREALERAVKTLEMAGYRTERVQLPQFEAILAAYDQFILTEFSLVQANLERLLGANSRRYLELASQGTKLLDLAGYVGMTGQRLGWQRQWQEFFATWPIIIGPVFSDLAAAMDDDIASLDSHRRISRSRALCSVSSFLGLPAVAVPTGLAEGLPVGVQLIAGACREDLCLDAALVIEAAFGQFGPIDPVTTV